MIYIKKLGEIICIYVICSVFSFLFNNGLYLTSKGFPFLSLVIPPVSLLLLTIWVYIQDLHRFVTLAVLTIVFLSFKSELIILYFDLCDISNQHSVYTGVFSSVCLAIPTFLLVKMFRNDKITIENLVMVFLAVIVFEVLFRIEFLSLINLLNSL
jgi:hypothetical protein